MSETNKNEIHDGTDPKALLKKRGGVYDGQGLFPQAPDFLGYLLGFMLIWLLYTGFGAVSGVLTHSKNKVVAIQKEVTSEAREAVVKIKEKAHDIEQQEVVRARLNSEESHESENIKKQSWTSRQLKKANIYIDVLVDKTGAMLAEAIADSDPEYTQTQEVVKETVSAPPVAPDYSLDRF